MDELMIVDGGLSVEVSEEIAQIEKSFKDLEAKEKELKAKLKAIMEENGIVKIDNEIISVTYVGESSSEKLDTKALKEELPDIYDTYVSISKRSAYVKIGVK